ncbi:hypothetical protein HK097_010543 [Rhizophlyctis rosea]|uniref:Actin maturation protease n=1 Tax=Rhizophlyctis rosea TaxID=64517 RepID=A0AAD5S7E4_9FUNG|nr:hypothetical protein HK097_010543 [Rhizophlyctis rosea]
MDVDVVTQDVDNDASSRRPATNNSVSSCAVAIETRLRRIENSLKLTPGGWDVFLADVERQLQIGPTCGLVALLLSSHYLSDTTSKTLTSLLTTARMHGYTKKGEMFSAYDLATLARDALSLDGRVEEWLDGEDGVEQVVKHLREGKLILVAYDKDVRWHLQGVDCDGVDVFDRQIMNHVKSKDPKLIGVLFMWHLLPVLRLTLSPGYTHPTPTSTSTAITLRHLPLPSSLSPPALSNLHLLCSHGKSLHQGIWSYKGLTDSNRNLQKVDDRVLECGEYVVPEGGRLDELRGKIVVVGGIR